MVIRMGKRTDFTPQEVELLRAFAREKKRRDGLTGDQLGQLMGISQQNASEFTKDRAVGGIGRTTANALAQNCDYQDAEELLRELKQLAAIAEDGVGNVWHARDSARRVAEAAGVASRAIEVVIEQRKTPADARRPQKWWLQQFLNQETQMLADGEVTRR